MTAEEITGLRVRGEVGRDRRQGAGVRRVPEEDDARDPAGAPHPGGVALTPWPCSRANFSRSVFFENLPTLVFGTSSMNSTASGSHHFATRGRRCSSTSVGGQRLALLHDHAGQRPLHPLLAGDGDHGGLGDLRVRHDLVLQLDRADPLAAGLDQVLRAVDEPEAAVAVDGRDVAGAQPAVVGELRAAALAAVVLASRSTGPRPASRRWRSSSHGCGLAGAGIDDPQVHERHRLPLPRPRVGALRLVERRRPSVRGLEIVAIGLVSVMPQACRIGTPSASLYASDSDRGTAEPPQRISRSADRS